MIKLMEVCGTHTHAIAKYGIKSIIPENIKLISGPGCPVCVTSQNDIDKAIWLASQENVIFCTFGDMLRVPGINGNSLEKLKSEGKDIRIVLSPFDSIKIAQNNPEKKVIFMATGFETTSPTVSATILKVDELNLKNFFIFSTHKLIIPAIDKLLEDKDLQIDGFILPGHVSVIIGKEPYEFIAKRYKKAGVITGFEASDILKGIYLLLKQIKEKNFKIEIQYKRAVSKKGNQKALEVLFKVFEPCDSEWRGIGKIEKSGLKLKKEFEKFDASLKFNIPEINSKENPKCICGEILKGVKEPLDCKLFKKVCNPLNPVGPCMVSSEGTCAAYFKYTGGVK